MTTDARTQPARPPEAAPALSEVMDLDARYVMSTYARKPVEFVRGEGARLWDSEGNEYLDFLAGIAVVGVGHCHPRVSQAIAAQAQTLMHVSNLFHNPLQATLARRLCGLTGMDRAFFCNSGAEANEAALKISRKFGKISVGAECSEIVTFTGSFHGRTLATVTATAQPKFQEPFTPLLPGIRYCPFNDLRALRDIVSEKTCAIMVEPIQGESGVHACDPEFLMGLRTLCDQTGALLILDEVQTGMGRTGKFLASQWMGISADVVTLAKGIANGVPMGVCLARGEAASTLALGDHGSTFGGQPLACAAALATLDVLESERLMENAAAVGGYLMERLVELREKIPGTICEVRGRGLMVGIDLATPIARTIAGRLLAAGIVVNPIGDSVLRLVPPLVVTAQDCDRFVHELRRALVAESTSAQTAVNNAKS
jgi:predicted acetylornithine/succinylornithine family transaminase